MNNIITLIPATHYIKKNPSYQNYQFQNDTFYVAGITLYSSTHVQKFDFIPYTSATDSYHINYNAFFPNGVDTILINSMNGEDKESTIILSDETFLKIHKEYQNHFEILLEAKNNRFRIASYLYSKRIRIQLPDRSKNQSLKNYGVLINNNYTGNFTYSILYYFFSSSSF